MISGRSPARSGRVCGLCASSSLGKMANSTCWRQKTIGGCAQGLAAGSLPLECPFLPLIEGKFQHETLPLRRGAGGRVQGARPEPRAARQGEHGEDGAKPLPLACRWGRSPQFLTISLSGEARFLHRLRSCEHAECITHRLIHRCPSVISS